MRKILDILSRVFTLNARDVVGIVAWVILSILLSLFLGVVGLLLTLGVMILREVWQWKHYRLSYFEWEDIVRYSFVIILGWVMASIL